MLKKITAVAVFVLAWFLVGCDKTGELKDPLPPYSYVTPTIQNLQVIATSVSRTTGGIMRVSCEWTSPASVSTATAYLGFVRTIQDTISEPVGIIASDTATPSANLLPTIMPSLRAVLDAEAEAFYLRFKNQIAIPTKIGTDQRAGMWSAEIPFTSQDIHGAPLGVHQMILYMSINGVKTNTLAFEMTITE